MSLENIQWFVETWSRMVDSCCVAVSCFNWRLSVCLCPRCLRTGDVTGAKSLRTQNVWVWNGSQRDSFQPCRPSFPDRNQVFNFHPTHDASMIFMSEPNRTHRGVGSESSYISVICSSSRQQHSIIIVVFYEKCLFEKLRQQMSYQGAISVWVCRTQTNTHKTNLH